MLISVINHTRGKKKVSDRELQQVIRAINRQVAEDFAPIWGMTARLRLEGRAEDVPDLETNSDMRGDAILYLLTSVADAGTTLGAHDLNNRGIPYGFVYTELSDAMGEGWSVTLSHEALELIADPEANLLVMGPHPTPTENRIVFHWFEMCDAVQTQTYKIDNIEVSNFVLPLYFTGSRNVDEKGARNNFLGTKLPSFGIEPGGYVGFYDPQTQSTGQIFGGAEAKRRSEIKQRAVATRRATRYEQADQRVARAEVVSEPAQEIAARELRAGDVLLYRRNGPLSRAIRFFDGRPVSHASIYLGSGSVGEALGRGVVETKLSASVGGTEWVMARRLARAATTMQPVLDRAQFYLGQHERYAYEEILLLAFLGITRKMAPTSVAGVMLRKILDRAAEVLNKLVADVTAGNKEPMICSEFVYRCYEESGDAGYDIRIGKAAAKQRALDSIRGRGIERGSLLQLASDPQKSGAARMLSVRPPAHNDATLEELLEQHEREAQSGELRGEISVTPDVANALSQFAFALHRTKAPSASGRRAAASPIDSLFATVKDFVTPGDLYDSGSLASLGHIVAADPSDQFAAAWQRAAKVKSKRH